jgi:hypothetical protein
MSAPAAKHAQPRITLDWNAMRWLCLGMAAGIMSHRQDWWAGVLAGYFVIASAIARATGEGE